MCVCVYVFMIMIISMLQDKNWESSTGGFGNAIVYSLGVEIKMVWFGDAWRDVGSDWPPI